MSNILEFLTWRGDLTFGQAPLSDVDALIFSRLSYIPFDGIIPERFQKAPVLLKSAAEICLALVHDKGNGRRFRMEQDEALLSHLIESPRYASLYVTGFVNRLDEAQEEQFSALTFLMPEEGGVVAFRGTDGTLIGWKEDFNMGFADSVPAQLDAVAYLQQAAQSFQGPIQICGHSKGGNLAVYAAAFCPEETQQRISQVRSNDGPGFNAKTIATPGFQRILARVRTFVPQSSVVGLLLEHEEDFSIIHSTSLGIFQHDVYSWEICRDGFHTVEALTNSSQFIDMALKDWVTRMTPHQREKMIDGIFSVLNASGGTTLRDLWNGKNTVAVVKAWAEMDEETKASINTGLELLRASLKQSIPAILDQRRVNSIKKKTVGVLDSIRALRQSAETEEQKE